MSTLYLTHVLMMLPLVAGLLVLWLAASWALVDTLLDEMAYSTSPTTSTSQAAEGLSSKHVATWREPTTALSYETSVLGYKLVLCAAIERESIRHQRARLDRSRNTLTPRLQMAIHDALHANPDAETVRGS